MNEPQIPLEPQPNPGFSAHPEEKSGGILPLGQHAQRFLYQCASNASPETLVTEINKQAAQGWEVMQILFSGTTFVAFLKRPH